MFAFRTVKRWLLRGCHACFGSRKKAWKAAAIAVSVLAMCSVVPARAACRIVDGRPSTTGNINMGTVVAPTNVAVGSVIATRQMTYDSVFTHQAWNCGTNATINESFLMSGNGSSNIYETNIPGIGIRVWIWSTGKLLPTPTPLPATGDYFKAGSSATGTGWLWVKVDLIVTGPIDLSRGNVLSYNVAPWHMVQNKGDSSPLIVSNFALQGTIASPTCSVMQSSIGVTLPPAFVLDLTTVGSTAKTTPFNLQANCSSGVNVNVTLTDAADISNRSTTLSLAPGSHALGVGLQILRGSTPIAYGPDSASAGNTNQWSAGVSSGGLMTIPLAAQYVRTSEALTPGTVKGTATFTMSYQ